MDAPGPSLLATLSCRPRLWPLIPTALRQHLQQVPCPLLPLKLLAADGLFEHLETVRARDADCVRAGLKELVRANMIHTGPAALL